MSAIAKLRKRVDDMIVRGIFEREDRMIRAGDQVWHAATQEEIRVAAVDHATNEIATSDAPARWIMVAACTMQVPASDEDHRAALYRWARDGGRRGVVARRELAKLWSDGKLGKAGT